jgi:diguanylate cyclase (GGDEF)-like protein/PAS domain S-box-containing protein
MKNILNIRLITVLIFSTVLIMSVFVGVRFYISKLKFEKSLTLQIDQIANRIASAVKPSIWTTYSKSNARTFYDEFASNVLDSELTGEYVIGIVVYSQFGHIYMGKFKNDAKIIVPYHDNDRIILNRRADLRKSFPIQIESMTLGKLELFINTDVFVHNQEKALIIELIQIGIVSVFFILVLFYAIKRALLAPMGRLQVARKTFESIGEAIAFTNEQGYIYDTNPTFQVLTQLSDEDIINKNINEFFPGKLEQLQSSSSIKHSIINWKGEAKCKIKENKSIPVLLDISTVNTASEDVTKKHEYIFVFQDISSRKETEKQLEKLAYFDRLTGLANRQFFENELETSFQGMQRSHNKIGLIYIDLDNFKQVNDTMGHSCGDEVLIEISKRFKSRIRESDFIARLGGDEFIVLVRNMSDSQQLASLAHDLNDIAIKPILINGIEYKLGASIGISMSPEDASTASVLLKNADIAMYHAKDNGKGQFSFYSSELNEKVERFFELKNSIDSALKNNEFELYYQPKVDMLKKTVVSAEALIRWITPEGNIVGPDVFIPIVEETRQIIPIGRWVIEQSVRQLKEWSGTKYEDITLSINLSPVQLYDEHLIDNLQNILDKSAVNPSQLEIEITESAVIQNTEKSIDILNQIKKLGFSLSLDDFGTGYSSLSHLRLLPVDTLKIDRSFLADVKEDNDSGAILSFIIKLADLLSISVIAEGIEDKNHMDFLVKHNCRLGQGYYFSPPLSIDEFEQFELNKTR